MKIWQMSDYDWIAAETLEEAKDCLAEELGMEKPEDLEEYIDDPYALSEADLDLLKFCDCDEHGDPDPSKPSRTFREELAQRVAANVRFPCYFAGTE